MEKYYEELCPICENNLLLTYICDDCTAVFCSDCLKEFTYEEPSCILCGSDNFVQNKKGNPICAECGSDKIIMVKKTEKICPKCGGNSVVKITDKINFIETFFRRTIMDTRRYLDPLSLVVDSVKSKINILINLREESPKIFHFPDLETELLRIVKIFGNLEEEVKRKTVDFYSDVNRNLKYFFGLESMNPKELPIVEGLVRHLETTSHHNMTYIRSSVGRLKERLEHVAVKLNIMRNIRNFFTLYSPAVGLGRTELPVYGFKCKFTFSDESDCVKFSGAILITNKNIYFITEKGLKKKKVALFSKIPLGAVKNYNIEGKFARKIIIETETGKYKIKTPDDKPKIIEYLSKAQSFGTGSIDYDNLETLRRLEIGVTDFRNALEEAIEAILEYGKQMCGNDGNASDGKTADTYIDKKLAELKPAENLPEEDNSAFDSVKEVSLVGDLESFRENNGSGDFSYPIHPIICGEFNGSLSKNVSDYGSEYDNPRTVYRERTEEKLYEGIISDDCYRPPLYGRRAIEGVTVRRPFERRYIHSVNAGTSGYYAGSVQSGNRDNTVRGGIVDTAISYPYGTETTDGRRSYTESVCRNMPIHGQNNTLYPRTVRQSPIVPSAYYNRSVNPFRVGSTLPEKRKEINPGPPLSRWPTGNGNTGYGKFSGNTASGGVKGRRNYGAGWTGAYRNGKVPNVRNRSTVSPKKYSVINAVRSVMEDEYNTPRLRLPYPPIKKENASDRLEKALGGFTYKNPEEELLTLKEEEYSLKMTLENLERKYRNGLISPSEYFERYRNLQKEIYRIGELIKKLNKELIGYEKSRML